MKRTAVLIFLFLAFVLQSCVVTERIVFNDDGSGNFEMIYDLSQMGDQMKGMFDTNDGADPMDDEEPDPMGDDEVDYSKVEKDEKELAKKPMDTLVYFDDLLREYADSLATLPEEERKGLESLSGMFMRMKTNEAEGVYEMGIGMDFKNISELKDVQDKVKQARSMNSPADAETMPEQFSFDKMEGNQEAEVEYGYDSKGFKRSTVISDSMAEILKESVDPAVDPEEESEDIYEEDTEGMEDMQMAAFESFLDDAVYYVEYTFPKKIESTSITDAEVSEDGKTVKYSVKWQDYLKNPKLLDIEVKLKDE